MKVFVAGATGVLGRRIIEFGDAAGHEMIGLSRSEQGDAVIFELGGEPRRGDLLEPETLHEAAAGADVIVHAATKIPTSPNPSDSEWETNDRVRREGAEHLISVAEVVGADRFIQQSVVWLARQPDGSPFDENAKPHPDRSTQSALDAERIVKEGANSHGYEPVILRGGYFYAPDTSYTQMFGERLLRRDMPIIGRGLLGRKEASLSFVHADDAASAFVAATDGEATGCFHVVDDEPVGYATFLQALTTRLDAPNPRRIPAWIARLGISSEIVDLLTHPMPTTNARFRTAFDWVPQYPTYREGLDQIVESWAADGTIRARGDGYVWANEKET